MCAYNRVNGAYCSENHWLLNQVLRDEWGFEGLVVTDWGATNDRGARASTSGLDLEMPGSGGGNDRRVARVDRSRRSSVRTNWISMTQSRRNVALQSFRRRSSGTNSQHDVDHTAHHDRLAMKRGHRVDRAAEERRQCPADHRIVAERIAVIGEFAKAASLPRHRQFAGQLRRNSTAPMRQSQTA